MYIKQKIIKYYAGFISELCLLSLIGLLTLILINLSESISMQHTSLAYYQQSIQNFYSLWLSNLKNEANFCENKVIGDYQFSQKNSLLKFSCIEQQLIKAIPPEMVTHNTKQYINYVFKENLISKPKQINNIRLIWLSENSKIEITGENNMLIISEKDLTILGKGIINGIIFIDGTLNVSPEVSLVYQTDIIEKVNQIYQQKKLLGLRDYD